MAGTATKRRRKSEAEVEAERQEAIGRARGGMSCANYSTIIREFAARGIPEVEIIPRVNVLTYRAWQAIGRQVRKGEKGVKVMTYIPTRETVEDGAGGEKRVETGKRPWTAAVFHISQTDPA